MQWWQVALVFGGGPLSLFGAIWTLVWVTTMPGTPPPGVAQPSDTPSGGMPNPIPREVEEGRADPQVDGPGEAVGETGASE